MTKTAIFCGSQVVHRFADGDIAIMAGGAIVCDAGMIEHGGDKRRRVMAA